MKRELKNKSSLTRSRKRSVLLIVVMLIVVSIWINNTNVFYPGGEEYKLLAHRGLAQTYDVDKADWNTNTAAIIHESEYDYLENTIASMQAAFDYGADVIEFDVKLIRDKMLVVFHDSTLEYRTDAIGEVGDYTMEELKSWTLVMAIPLTMDSLFHLEAKVLD